MKIIKAAVLILVIFCVTGCSLTLHERKKREEDVDDLGTKTEFQFRGPKAKVSHTF